MPKNRTIPFGYGMANGRYVINCAEAELVRKIFAEYIGGESLKSIAADIHVPYCGEKTGWSKNIISRILCSRKYIGENGYPRIISDEDFKVAAQLRETRCTYHGSSKRNKLCVLTRREIRNTIYESTEEIRRMTNEINRLLELVNPDKDVVMDMILRCAEQKYYEIKWGDNNVRSSSL